MTDTQHEAEERVSEGALIAIETELRKGLYQISADESAYRSAARRILSALRAHDAGQAGVSWDVQEYKIWKGINPYTPCWHSRGFSCPSWADANELLELLEHNDHGLLLRVAPNTLSALSTRPEPTGSLVGDALAAAGQSIGMSVTHVHPETEKVGEVIPDGWVMVPRKATAEMLAAFWRQKNTGAQTPGDTGPKRDDFAAYRSLIAAAPPAPVAIDEAMVERLRTQLLRHREVEVDAAGLRAALTDAAALNPQPNGGRDGQA